MFGYRSTKAFAAALISIGIGIIVLKTLGGNPISAGAFSLSEYYRLTPIKKVISVDDTQIKPDWDCIEISYSGTKAGNIKQLTALAGMVNPLDINYHFIICNGLGGDDGLIQPTEKWLKQWPISLEQIMYGSANTIRICVIADDKDVFPTDFQIKRTEALVETFSRKFDINPDSIYYPDNWW